MSRDFETLYYELQSSNTESFGMLGQEVRHAKERAEKAEAELARAFTWAKCAIHGPGSLRAWGCPECVVELRKQVAEGHAYARRVREELLDIQSLLYSSCFELAKECVRDALAKNPE